jgi:hypothetical protein
MNIAALITFSSAVAVRLIGCASEFQGAAVTRLPVPVIFTGPAATVGSAAARCRMGVMT